MLITSVDRVADYGGRAGISALSREEFIGEARAGGVPGSHGPWIRRTRAYYFYQRHHGAPKAAVLRQKHLVSYVLGSVEFMSAMEEDAALGCATLPHSGYFRGTELGLLRPPSRTAAQLHCRGLDRPGE